ncbi:MAG: mechanosensitive ion channel family protein [Deltaproteobacteria bacterium]|nr:mechanosensitive ion channel family protein [Deltaproteobacteria bacterium]
METVTQIETLLTSWISNQSLLKAVATTGLLIVLYLIHLLTRFYVGRLVTRTEIRQNYWGYFRNFFILVSLILTVGVWLEELKTVTLVLAGVMAGLIITNKELVLGISGRFALAAGEHYRIGDRIRINGILGDVISIGLLFTWLLEVDGQHGENQATGRVVLIPHMWLTQFAVINSTHGHDYLWDEIPFSFPVWVEGAQVIQLLVSTTSTVLKKEIEEAALLVPRLGLVYAAKSPPVTPIAYAQMMTDTTGRQSLMITLRYVVRARARRQTHSALTLNLLHTLRMAGIPLLSMEPMSTLPAQGVIDLEE